MKTAYLSLVAMFLSVQVWAGHVNGKYTGNGASSKAIAGLGFVPDVIMVKGGGFQTGWIATSTMSPGKAKMLGSTDAPAGGYINSIDVDGFTVGSSSLSNASGVIYYFTAWDDDATVDVGSFTANDCAPSWCNDNWYSLGSLVKYGANNYRASVGHTSSMSTRPDLNPSTWSNKGPCNAFNTNISLGYRPEMVWIFGEGTNWDEVSPGQFIIDGSPSGNLSFHFNQGGSLGSEYQIIDDLYSNGFKIRPTTFPGYHNGPTVGVKYNYVAFIPGTSIETNIFAGDATPRTINTSITPDFVLVVDKGGSQNPWFKTAQMTDDYSYKFTDIASDINIKKLITNGFKIGVGGEVNQSGRTFEFFVMGGASPLPIDLVSFNAEKEENKAMLSWTTASEINSSLFIVERSSDTSNFTVIGELSAAGNSDRFINYFFVDENPLPNVNYYRLKQVDYDGQYAVYLVKALNFSGLALNSLNLYPTLVSQNINLSIVSEEENVCTLQIFDAMANECHKSLVIVNKGVNQLSLPSSSLADGYYIVRITLPTNESHQLKFMKQ